MSTLIDFIRENETSNASALSVPQAAMERALVLSLEDTDVPTDKALKFAADLAKLIVSESFLKELSAEIREPGLTESEDAFVVRSKEVMIKLLERRLG